VLVPGTSDVDCCALDEDEVELDVLVEEEDELLELEDVDDDDVELVDLDEVEVVDRDEVEVVEEVDGCCVVVVELEVVLEVVEVVVGGGLAAVTLMSMQVV